MAITHEPAAGKFYCGVDNGIAVLPWLIFEFLQFSLRPMMPIKPVLSMLSPPGESARLSILIFHRVLSQPDPIFPGEVDVRQFDQILHWVKRWCNVLPLEEATTRLKGGTLPARAAAITFDDGYADNHDNALPILQQHGLSATFFIATGYLDGGRMWNDSVIEAVRNSTADHVDLQDFELAPPPGAAQWPLGSAEARRDLIGAILGHIKYADPTRRQDMADAIAARLGGNMATNLMMSSDQVRKMRRAGMEIGAHTHTHPILARLDREVAYDEIRLNKTNLEGLLNEPVKLFAYPNGRPAKDYLSESVEVVRSLGFTAAVTTAVGAADRASDPLQLPRFTPWDRTKTRFGLRLAANLMGKRPIEQ
ncbi:MAG TPA: polysaccharide deacetylase family protein [Candidatus Acidoferrum sp.]|nr:polysaccharide deacetylase family protein [Candidatus Acidoferrum sp.]